MLVVLHNLLFHWRTIRRRPKQTLVPKVASYASIVRSIIVNTTNGTPTSCANRQAHKWEGGPTATLGGPGSAHDRHTRGRRPSPAAGPGCTGTSLSAGLCDHGCGGDFQRRDRAAGIRVAGRTGARAWGRSAPTCGRRGH